MTGGAYTKSYELEAKKDYAGAQRALGEVRFAERSTYFYNLRTAWLSSQAGHKAEALAAYNRAANLFPDSIEPLIGRISAEAALTQWDAVERTAQAILRVDSKNYTARSSLAYAKFCQQRYTEAEQAYEDVLKLYPYDTTMQEGLGWSLIWQGRRRDAISTFTDILEFAPSNEAAAQALGKDAPAESASAKIIERSMQFEAKGNYAEALIAMSELSGDESKRTYFFHLRTGWLYYMLGQYERSAASYGRAASMAKDAVQPLLGKAQSEAALLKWDAVAKSLEAALRLDPKNYTARSSLANAYYFLNRFKDSESLYREILKEYPGDLTARSGLGWSLLKQAKTTEAIREFKIILRVNPTHNLATIGLDEAQAVSASK